MPRAIHATTNVGDMCIEILNNRVTFSIQADTILRDIANQYPPVFNKLLNKFRL